MKKKMNDFNQEKKMRKEVTEIKTFPVPFNSGEIKKNISVNTNTITELSKETLINQAIQLHQQGNIQKASKLYQKFISQGFNDQKIFTNYGIILKDLGRLQEAELATRKAIDLNPNLAMAYSNLGSILNDLGKSKEAELAIRKAIKLNPHIADSYSNLGSILTDLGRLKEAKLATQKAIELNPYTEMAHYNLGSILSDLGQLEEAKLATLKALELNPDFAKAHASMGKILLETGELDLSLKYFSTSSELIRSPNKKKSHHKNFLNVSKAKIDHDIEQFEYLVSQGYEIKMFANLAVLYKKITSEINWPSETELITLSDKHESLIQDSYNRLLHVIDAPQLKEEAVNNALNVETISNDYFDHDFGLTYIDNFLSTNALNSLRKFLLESTIWFDIKPNGYLGAYLMEGLPNPLIIQIAKELKNKFPKIFKNYPITQIWAYKYDSRAKNEHSSLKGINVHADFAAINVNFWITPKEANLNDNSGGLIVYDVEAPKDWDFKTFNNNEAKIRAELEKSKGNTKIIPYNENRAVVFNSNLFHETDNYEFKEGYENRRINITMLFGKRSNN